MRGGLSEHEILDGCQRDFARYAVGLDHLTW
jgi:hypothetical protein